MSASDIPGAMFFVHSFTQLPWALRTLFMYTSSHSILPVMYRYPSIQNAAYYLRIERNEQEGARTANGVDKPKVGTEGRYNWCMGFFLFPRFSFFGKVMSDQC